MQAAARDANARGGLAGEPIVLDIQDDGCDPGRAVEVAERFVRSGIRLVVGHVCSSASLAASDVYAAAGAVMISPASNAARLTDRGLPTIFRVSGREDDQGRLSATVLAERFRDKKIAILYDDTPLSRSLADSTKANLNKIGQNEALFAAIVPGQTDDAALVKRLQGAGIEVVYYGGHYQEMGRLVRKAAEQGYRPQWFGTSGIATREFGALAGPASDGVLMTFNPDLRRKPEAAAAVKALQADGVEPEGFTLYGYAALQALVAAATSPGRPSRGRSRRRCTASASRSSWAMSASTRRATSPPRATSSTCGGTAASPTPTDPNRVAGRVRGRSGPRSVRSLPTAGARSPPSVARGRPRPMRGRRSTVTAPAVVLRSPRTATPDGGRAERNEGRAIRFPADSFRNPYHRTARWSRRLHTLERSRCPHPRSDCAAIATIRQDRRAINRKSQDAVCARVLPDLVSPSPASRRIATRGRDPGLEPRAIQRPGLPPSRRLARQLDRLALDQSR